MRNLILLTVLIAALSGQLGCSSGEQDADLAAREITVREIATQTPEQATLLFENDYVLVAHFAIEPGEVIPAHYGRNRAVYALNDLKMRSTEGEQSIIEEPRMGTIHWHSEGIHSAKNVGDSTARFIVVFRKLSRLFDYSVVGRGRATGRRRKIHRPGIRSIPWRERWRGICSCPGCRP